MPRLLLKEESNTPTELVDRIKRERGGRFLALYRLLAHSPKVAQAWLQFFTVVRQQCDLDARHRELAILSIARINGARYEFDQHIPFALRAGLTQTQLDQIDNWRDSSGFTQTDRAVLAYSEAMTRSVKVPNDVFAAVRAEFDDKTLVELTVTIAGYNMVSRVLEAMEVHQE